MLRQVGITQGYAIAHAIGLAEERYLDAPREARALIAFGRFPEAIVARCTNRSWVLAPPDPHDSSRPVS